MQLDAIHQRSRAAFRMREACNLHQCTTEKAGGQPEWATVLTPGGVRPISQINAGDPIWSGKRWARVEEKARQQPAVAYGYATRAGMVYVSRRHALIKNGITIEAEAADAVDIVSGFQCSASSWSVNPQDVMDGLVLGDGTVHRASNDLVCLVIGEKDGDYLKDDVAPLLRRSRPGIKKGFWEIETSLSARELLKTYERSIPDRFRFGPPAKAAGFLRGLYSANGSVVMGRVTLKGTSLAVIQAAQEMLSAMGISSYYTVNKATRVAFANGTYTCRESYDLNVSSDRGRFQQIIGFIHHRKRVALADAVGKYRPGRGKRTYPIKEVFSCGVEPLYSLQLDDASNTYWSGGLLVCDSK